MYTDGTSQSFTLSAPDWYVTPPAGSDPAITMPYRNAPGNAQDNHPVHVYYVGVPLAQGKTVQAVVLPDVSGAPPTAGLAALHVFAMAIG
jgi:alpha-L-fucosidase 2